MEILKDFDISRASFNRPTSIEIKPMNTYLKHGSSNDDDTSNNTNKIHPKKNINTEKTETLQDLFSSC